MIDSSVSVRPITLTDVSKRDATGIDERKTVLHRVPGVCRAADAPVVHEDPNYGERDRCILCQILLPRIFSVNLWNGCKSLVRGFANNSFYIHTFQNYGQTT